MKDKKELIGTKSCSADIENVSFRIFKYTKSESEIVREMKYVSLHIHTYHEIILSTENELTMLTAGGKITLHCGDIAIVPPDYQHTMVPSESWKKGWIDLDVSCIKNENKSENDLWKKYRHLFDISAPLIFRNAGHLTEELRRIDEMTIENDSITPILNIALLLEELSTMRYEQAVSSGKGSNKGKNAAEGLDYLRFAILNDIVGCRFTEDIDPDEVASCLYISRRHLDRIIKNRFGSTLRELINEKRIELSKKLIEEKNCSVEEIAAMTGFSSVAVFCRAFRKSLGISPTDYRKNIRNKE